MAENSTTILSTKVVVAAPHNEYFAAWQAKLNAAIARFPGFISLEIRSPTSEETVEWVIVQRFVNQADMRSWQASHEYQNLLEQLKQTMGPSTSIQEEELEPNQMQGGVTEVLITEIHPEKAAAYREWIAKIHAVEATFPGFRGTYVQSPSSRRGKNWITLLQFDTMENLDRWLASPERKKVLEESGSMVTSLESHRVISPYAGWFSSIAKSGELPPLWKQTMLVLLVLFPIVMLELIFLSPLTASLNRSLGMFIGNAISVTLISWPMMPIALWFLGWWAVPTEKRRQKTVIGTFLVVLLYLIEIACFWPF